MVLETNPFLFRIPLGIPKKKVGLGEIVVTRRHLCVASLNLYL